MKSFFPWAIFLLVAVVAAVAFQQGWPAVAGTWVDGVIEDFSAFFAGNPILGAKFMVMGLLGVVLVSFICGSVSSLVVSNRMAFFSDAIAHCAFAGIGLGIILKGLGLQQTEQNVAIVFGVVVGMGIAFVKEKTTLANDTVIGVFFAAAMGVGGILLKVIRVVGERTNPEDLMFGSLLSVDGQQLVYLALVLAATLLFLLVFYNRFVFVSFNPSLARSRSFPVRLCNYLFIILLGLIVNICYSVVGILLINAMLILPAATASNVSRNLRQFFWISTVLSFVAGFGGLIASDYWTPVIGGVPFNPPSGSTIVVIGAALFFASLLAGKWIRGERPSLRPSL